MPGSCTTLHSPMGVCTLSFLAARGAWELQVFSQAPLLPGERWRAAGLKPHGCVGRVTWDSEWRWCEAGSAPGHSLGLPACVLQIEGRVYRYSDAKQQESLEWGSAAPSPESCGLLPPPAPSLALAAKALPEHRVPVTSTSSRALAWEGQHPSAGWELSLPKLLCEEG